MKLYVAYQTKSDCFKAGTSINPVGIVWHSTGANNPNLKRYVDAPDLAGQNPYHNHWNQPGVGKMVHAFIGKDKNGEVAVIQTLPYNFAAWGVGRGSKGSYNYNPTAHIQFEVCEDDLTDKAYFEAVYQAGIEYCAYLCKLLNLKPESICSHKEAYERGYASNHKDPHHWFEKFGKTMDQVRKDVASLLRPVIPGDVNEDGKVTATDARLALQAAVGKIQLTDKQREAADIDKDGDVDVSDARKILQKSVGKVK